jgi:hypothetical protein
MESLAYPQRLDVDTQFRKSFGKVDLSFAETVPSESCRAKASVGWSSGRSLGFFKAHLPMRLSHVRTKKLGTHEKVAAACTASGTCLFARPQVLSAYLEHIGD